MTNTHRGLHDAGCRRVVGEDSGATRWVEGRHAVGAVGHVPMLRVDDRDARVVDEDLVQDAQRSAARGARAASQAAAALPPAAG